MRAFRNRERTAVSRLLALIALAVPLMAQAHTKVTRADDHAPIGVMADHYHGADEVMFSWRRMDMTMDGNRNGTTELSRRDVLDDYNVAPLEMRTTMDMFGLMYAPTDRVTLMAMLASIRKKMELVNGMGQRFSTRSNGSGDLKLTAILHPEGAGPWHFHLGVNAPTGSIQEEDDTPMGRMRLPYPMQMGSGTWDLRAGATVLGRSDHGSWGAQVSGVLRTGENELGYRLGNRVETTGWAAWAATSWLSPSLRIRAEQWGNIAGEDDALNPAMAPTADPDQQAGRRASLGAGLNLRIPNGPLARHRLALEYSEPLYQDLDGPQMQAEGMLTAGWQYDFSF